MPGGRDRLRRTRAVVRATAAGLAILVLAPAGPASGQAARPNYLGYTEFAADDAPQAVALKRAYNDAVHRYNQSLYDYHVTLEKHDRLVELHNRSVDPAEQKKARDEATVLRNRLTTLRRDVTANAAAVDEAARRAAAGGVSLTR